jgi:hypothetical protein
LLPVERCFSTERIEGERRPFAVLNVTEMEQLAAESQALVDRAVALSRARIAAASNPQPDVIESESTGPRPRRESGV